MGVLFDRIVAAVAHGRYAIGLHAAERLDERGIPDWQIVAGLTEGLLLRERRRSKPNPCVEVEQSLPDGTSVKTVWSWLPVQEAAKLVTVHYFDR